MSIGFQSVGAVFFGFINAVFTVYLFLMVVALIYSTYRPRNCRGKRTAFSVKGLRIALLLPFYRESNESVSVTLKSILKQTYPKNLIKAYLIVEADDDKAKEIVESSSTLLDGAGLDYEVIEASSRRRYGKADALNTALPKVLEDAIIVFDADDEIPPNYIEEVVRMIKDGYEAVTTKVYRLGEGIYAKLLALDTFFWYDIMLQFYSRMNQYVPFSGEGMAVKTEVIKGIGGFPPSLTEDAYLTIELSVRRKKIAYLSNTYIIEKAPRSFSAHVGQRLRWFQGYLECLTALTAKLSKLPLRKTVLLFILFFSPISALLTGIFDTVFTTYWVAEAVHYEYIATGVRWFFTPLIFYWSLILIIIGNLFIISFLFYSVRESRFKALGFYVYVLPIYWMINSFIAAASLFVPRTWRKTIR